jgi:beta-N-acetylhexosaminidase
MDTSQIHGAHKHRMARERRGLAHRSSRASANIRAGRGAGSRKGALPGTGKPWLRTSSLIVAIIAAATGIAFAANAVAGRSAAAHSPAGHAAAKPAARPGLRGSAPVRSSAAPAAPLPRLTERQMAGQRVIYSYSGLTPPASLLSLIRHGEAAGVIFFGQNISSPAQLKAAVKALERADASRLNPVRTPLLLMTDQEGGEVRRLPGQPYQSEKEIGESAHPQIAATDAGRGAGQNLLGAGLNVNLAPVLDVYRHPGDFDDQFQRSYSRNARIAGQLGADFIGAQQKAGVAATAKHFPGLGAAARSQDTDIRPVTLRLSARTIRNVDELPYRAAIKAGVKLVMVSWARYTHLDPKFPAGLSAVIVQGELRGRLRFSGVTITDALEAGALKAFGTYSHRAQLAAGAGMDLILAADQDVTQGVQAMDGLESGYRHGTLGHAAFRASLRRILALRAGLPA